jgi:hypothetical protein
MLRGTYLLIKALLLGTVVQNCGTDTDTATFLNASFAPDAPKPGDAVTLSFAYDLHKPITGGIAAYSVTLNGIPFNTKDDLCKQVVPKIPARTSNGAILHFPKFQEKCPQKFNGLIRTIPKSFVLPIRSVRNKYGTCTID